MRIFTTNFGTVKEVDPGGIIATASQRRKKRERNDLLKKARTMLYTLENTCFVYSIFEYTIFKARLVADGCVTVVIAASFACCFGDHPTASFTF